MTDESLHHPIELAAEWGSALLLAFAAGFVARVSLVGIGETAALVASLGAALAAGGGAWLVLRRRPGRVWPMARFAPLPIDQLTVDDELLLTDPLEVPPQDSRVVRLFAPETLDVPGALAARIEDWLDGARSRHRGDADGAPPGHGPMDSPASAALHSALAEIRRSLG